MRLLAAILFATSASQSRYAPRGGVGASRERLQLIKCEPGVLPRRGPNDAPVVKLANLNEQGPVSSCPQPFVVPRLSRSLPMLFWADGGQVSIRSTISLSRAGAVVGSPQVRYGWVLADAEGLDAVKSPPHLATATVGNASSSTVGLNVTWNSDPSRVQSLRLTVIASSGEVNMSSSAEDTIYIKLNASSKENPVEVLEPADYW